MFFVLVRLLVVIGVIAVPVVFVAVFVRHVQNVGFHCLDLALRLRRECEQRCRIGEDLQRLAYRRAFRIVSRSVLEADHVRRGNS